MSTLGRSTGRDLSIAIVAGDGTNFNLGNILDFKPKQEITKQRVKPINGKNAELVHIDGWSGSIQVERMSADIDNYFATQEKNYYNGISSQPCTMQLTINEPNGSVTQWRFTGGTLTFDNAGDWQQDKSVSLTIGFFFSSREPI
ncbi:hypothetical protein ICN48_05720 [Polynucleobacter sp. JS-Safj-400b-B2]|uniref:hypothetical protein n=1 Tax=Polynucleobacter sp. JS-Safj-400b-B2 TaxID=2576921 RepID=UPI001C0C8079|nr:hypothetical protein [Polynucleobacter sp. JS-Safj-400b-B2]MBU3625732.1 hypothetical protein [Polynucleobacter sp. JS-Safj-400b-B2]